jgi:hypothetical protein
MKMPYSFARTIVTIVEDAVIAIKHPATTGKVDAGLPREELET